MSHRLTNTLSIITEGDAMKKLIGLFAAILIAAAGVASAHEGHEHVRGVVTAVAANSVTVDVAGKGAKVLTLTDKTVYKKAGKAAHLADLKVGDRVVVEVPEKTTEAAEVQIGVAAAKTDVKK
jgi:hypothetical protein